MELKHQPFFFTDRKTMACINFPVVQGWVFMYGFAQLIFGCGIGGEYPMTSTCATEASEEDRQYGQRHRGRKVMLSYTMQVSWSADHDYVYIHIYGYYGCVYI